MNKLILSEVSQNLRSRSSRVTIPSGSIPICLATARYTPIGEGIPLAQGGQGQGPIRLGELPAIFAPHQGMMDKNRFRKEIVPVQPGEKKLGRGGGQQILAADNEIDPVIKIIDQADQLIGRQILLPPENKIPHRLTERHLLPFHPKHAPLRNPDPLRPICPEAPAERSRQNPG